MAFRPEGGSAPLPTAERCAMLSYQHIYHAGNLADVHKHAVLAVSLAYLTQKDKPLTYLETHAGRGLYHLDAAEALKTGEAAAGIGRNAAWFAGAHPLARAIAAVKEAHGASAYPGSPMIAARLLRPSDRMVLAELHPQEFTALEQIMSATGADCRKEDGLRLAKRICPPDPARGLMLVDPSWEVKSDYVDIPEAVIRIHKRWPVGVIILWYPLLTGGSHEPMLIALENAIPQGLRHEVRFPPAREGHRMVGSGLFVVNPPYGIGDELARLSGLFAAL